MRYSSNYKASARAKLLDASSALAKKNGFGTTGVDALMAAVGLTSGAFYSHFKSKPELLKAILEKEIAITLAILDCPDTSSLLNAMRLYLSMEHMAAPETGCFIPALGAEISRADEATRKSFERGMMQLQLQIQKNMPSKGDAWAAIATATGAITIARGMVDSEIQQEILNAAASHIESMARQDEQPI